jgi:hypothetical protein
MQRTAELESPPEPTPVASLTLDRDDAALIARALRLLAKRAVRAQQLLRRLEWRAA